MRKIEKELEKRKKSIIEKEEQYNQNVKEFNDVYIQYINSYNTEICLINGEILMLREEISRLYDFLVSINGNMSKQIMSFDFVSEKMLSDNCREKAKSMEVVPNNENKEKSYYVIVSEPIHIPIIELYSIFKNHNDRKKELQNLTIGEQQKESEYLADLARRSSDNLYAMEIYKIAKIYRETIVMIKDCIKEKIIPELECVQSFLYAEAIKDQIIAGKDIQNIVINSISEYKGTIYNSYYQFVENVFSFYSLIVVFFTKQILNDIIRNGTIKNETKEQFENSINEIKNSINMMGGIR